MAVDPLPGLARMPFPANEWIARPSTWIPAARSVSPLQPLQALPLRSIMIDALLAPLGFVFATDPGCDQPSTNAPPHERGGSSVAGLIVKGPEPGMLNWTPVAAPQLALTILIASRSDPVPESAVLVTNTGAMTLS